MTDEVERLKAELEDARSTIKSWFEVRSVAQEQLTPAFVNGVKGYLRTSRNGGMPEEQSNMVEGVLEDFASLYLTDAMWPLLLRIAEEKRGELKVPDGLAPQNGMTDQKIYDAITKHLERTPQMPKNVSDMDEHELKFFKVISYQSGMLLFLQNVFADRLRYA